MKYTLHQREIRVVPVEIEANSLEEAKEMLREGDGDYQNDRAYPSDLLFDDICDNRFETGFDSNGVELPFAALNS